MAQQQQVLSQESIVARLERLPLSGWYVRIMAVGGLAGFFDAFDAFAIAFVLPALVGPWHIAPAEIGFLISSGYIGQLVGSLTLSWVAERFGRVVVLRWTLLIFGVVSLACGFAWGYWSLAVFRFIQGIGLGAEGPLAATYMNEFTKAKYRGRLISLFQVIFGLGATVVSLVAAWVVPHLGWEWMFYIGALPALLGVWLRRLVPESPRWLAAQGRLEDADHVLAGIEREASKNGARALPPVPATVPSIARERAGWASLFAKGYAVRTITVWAIAFCLAMVSYSLLTWMPTVFRTVYKLPIEVALQYGVILSASGTLGACCSVALLDWIGRRLSYLISFGGCCIPLFLMWFIAERATAFEAMVLASTGRFFIGIATVSIWVYFTEIFPTRMRSIGSGSAGAWVRIASIVGPSAVGVTLAAAGIGGVFLLFALTALLGTAIVFLFLVETRGKLLEEIAR